MTDERFSPAAMALQKEWVALARDILNNRITGSEFEKRKKELELKSLKVEKVNRPQVPPVVQAAVKTFNGSAHRVERGCDLDS